MATIDEHGDDLRRPLPPRAQARLGRHGRRLARRGPGARPPGRDQDPPRALRERRRSSSSASGARRTHAAGLSHPNIVSIYDRGEVGGSYFIVMEYVEGRTLKELIVTRGPCPVPVAISYVAAGARGAPLRAPERHRPPRHQAAQRPRRPRGARQGRRLRHRARRHEPDDRGRLDHRHGAVPLARAGARRAGRRVLRSLLDRDRPVRAAHGQGAVHGRDPGRDRDEAPLAGAAERRRRSAPRSRTTSTSSSFGPSRRSPPIATGPARRWTATSSSSRRGDAVGPETEEAATMVLRGESTAQTCRPAADRPATAATSAIAPTRARSRPAGRGGRGSSPRQPRSRSGSAAGSCTTTSATRSTRTSRSRSTSTPGILEQKAVALIDADGFEHNVRRLPNADVQPGLRLPAGPGAGDEAAARVDRHDPRLQRQAEGDGAEPRGQVARRRGGGADPPPARAQRGAGELVATGEPGHRAGPEGGRRRRRRLLGADQRLVRARSRLPCRASSVRATTPAPRSSSPPASPSAGSTSTATSLPARSSTRARPATRPPRRARRVTLSVSKGPTTVTVPDVIPADRRGRAGDADRAPASRSTSIHQDTDDESLDGLVIVAGSGRQHAGGPEVDRDAHGRAVRAAARRDHGHDVDRHHVDRHDDHDSRRHDPDRSVSDRIRLAVLAGGRSSEHEISLASAASVAAALDPARYDVRTIEIGRDGRWALPTGETRAALPATTTGRDASRAGRLRPGDARRRRRRAADPPRPVRRGRHRAGPLRARRRRVRRPRRARLVGLHGQGRLQDADARRRASRWRATSRSGSASRSRIRSATRSSSSPRNMGSSVGISKVRDESELDAGCRARPPPRREGDGRGVRRRHGGRGRRARQPSLAGRLAPGPGRLAQRRLVRLLARSTTRAARSSWSRRRASTRRRSSGRASSPSRRSWRRRARAWRAPTSSSAPPTARS